MECIPPGTGPGPAAMAHPFGAAMAGVSLPFVIAPPPPPPPPPPRRPTPPHPRIARPPAPTASGGEKNTPTLRDLPPLPLNWAGLGAHPYSHTAEGWSECRAHEGHDLVGEALRAVSPCFSSGAQAPSGEAASIHLTGGGANPAIVYQLIGESDPGSLRQSIRNNFCRTTEQRTHTALRTLCIRINLETVAFLSVQAEFVHTVTPRIQHGR